MTDVWIRTSSYYRLIFSPKKTGFSKKKKSSQKRKKKFYLFSMQLFSADATMFSNIYIFFFDHKKLKKPPSKVAHNRPKPFLRQSSPGHSPQPRSSFPFYKKSNAILSLLLSGLHHLLSYCFQYWKVYFKEVFSPTA